MSEVNPKTGKKMGRPYGAKSRASFAELFTLSQQCQEHTPKIVRYLLNIAARSQSDAARVAACSELLDRGYGKPRQSHEVVGQIDHVLVDARQEIRSAVARLAAGEDARGDLRVIDGRGDGDFEVAVEVLGKKGPAAASG